MNQVLRGIKTVIFDMDGTMLDSEPIHARAIQEVFAGYDIQMSVEDIMNRYIGWGDDNVYKDKTELHSHITHPEFINQKDNLLLKIVDEIDDESFKNYFAEGFLELIDKLKGEKIQVAVVSASARITVNSFLNKAKILEKFDYTLTRDEVYETKPSPACYLEGMRSLGSKSEETVIFEDSNHGLISAINSGAKVFAMDFGLNDKSALKHINNQELQVNGNFNWLFKTT